MDVAQHGKEICDDTLDPSFTAVVAAALGSTEQHCSVLQGANSISMACVHTMLKYNSPYLPHHTVFDKLCLKD